MEEGAEMVKREEGEEEGGRHGEDDEEDVGDHHEPSWKCSVS